MTICQLNRGEHSDEYEMVVIEACEDNVQEDFCNRFKVSNAKSCT